MKLNLPISRVWWLTVLSFINLTDCSLKGCFSLRFKSNLCCLYPNPCVAVTPFIFWYVQSLLHPLRSKLTPRSRVVLEKLIVVQIFKEVFYINRIQLSISVFKTILCYFLKIQFNVILKSMISSPQFSVTFSFFYQSCECISYTFHVDCIPHQSHPSLFSKLMIFFEE
jgi:hypothetical protein